MPIQLVGPGAAALASGSAFALTASPGIAAAPMAQYAGAHPSDISGLSGWWDAGQITDANGNANAMSSSGVAMTTGGAMAGGWLVDKSGGGRNLSCPASGFNGVRVPTGPMLVMRLVGNPTNCLGGLGGEITANTNQFSPLLDPGLSYSLPGGQLGSGSAWTRYLVCSRPNLTQESSRTDHPLLAIGTTILASVSSTGSGDTLTLFPGSASPVTIPAGTFSFSKRWTHSFTFVNTPGSGLSVWIDDTQVATGVTNPLASSLSGTLYVCGISTGNNSAQLYIHELATWERALSGADLATLLTGASSVSKRWTRGARRNYIIPVLGQSNAAHWNSAGSTWTSGAAYFRAGVRYYLGALAVNVVTGAESGHGIWANTGAAADTTDWVQYPGSGAANVNDPSTWALSADGNNFQGWVNGSTAVIANPKISASDWPDFAALLIYWSEADSQHQYSEKALTLGAAKRMISAVRGMVGLTPAQMPTMWWNPMNYYGDRFLGGAQGLQAIREVVADLVATGATWNVHVALPNVCDTNPIGSTYNADGTYTVASDSGSHMDDADNQRNGRLAAILTARAILAAGNTDPNVAIPAGLPTKGGPQISHVYLHPDNQTLTITVAHDIGTDLKMGNGPGATQAAKGVGWAVMDGQTTITANPTLIYATSCTRIDATHLQVVLASPVQNPSNSLLFYPYGGMTSIYLTQAYTMWGRGTAVYDNASAIPPPGGFNLANDMNDTAWTMDYPLAATFYGIPLSSSPT